MNRLLDELDKLRERQQNTAPSGRSRGIISSEEFIVKDNINQKKDLTEVDTQHILKGVASEGRILIGTKEEVEIMAKWIDFKKQQKKKEQEIKDNNQRVIKSYRLKKGINNVKNIRDFALAPVTNIETARQSQSKKKS